MDIIIRNNYLWKTNPLKVRGCGLAITTRRLFCSSRFGAVRLLYVWGFTLSDIGDKFKIGVSEGGIVCVGGVFSAGGFCVESFTLFEMGYKLPNGAEKFPINGIDGALEKY